MIKGDKVVILAEIELHLSPTQHWVSAKRLFNKNKALWAALTIETKNGNIFVGDSRYGKGRYFKRDKEKI